ncbi:MAG: TrbI/VirB10 family protein [Pseudomonadota bacterium]
MNLPTSISAALTAFILAMAPMSVFGQDTEPLPRITDAGNNTFTQQPGVTDFVRDVRRNTSDESFVAAATNEFPAVALARPLPDLDRYIPEGTIIDAVMETRLISELPGKLRAIVSTDVRSFDGSVVLIPKGARMYGTYNSDTELGQDRALIIWSRVITPDGLSMMIGSPGVDRLGSAGISGKVDRHFGTRFGSAFLISVIGAAPTVATAEVTNETTAEIVSDVGSGFDDATSDTLSQYLSKAPTIYIDQGTQVNALVARDIVFPF